MQQEPPVGPDRHAEATRQQEQSVAGTVEARAQATLVVRPRPDVVPVSEPASRWRQSLAALRTAVPTLARHPVVRAAAPWAGVGAGLLLGHLAGARRADGAPVSFEGTVRVEVVQHVVHHVVHEVVRVPPRELPPS